MQLTLNEQWGVELTPSGVTFKDNTPEEVVIETWKWGYIAEKYGGKVKRSSREYYEKNWGPRKALVVEARIITDLGFEVTERIALNDADPIPSTDKLKKVFTALQERWKVAIETGNVEYLKLASDALRPMVEEWNQINEYLAKREIGA